MPAQVNRDQVRDLIRRGAQLLDVLPKEEYEQAHLPGAINIPLKELDAASAARLDRERPAIAYCFDFQ
jgi:rhodanese-related sulfurtransferase